MTFKKWIAQYKGENSVFNDFALDIGRDPHFPETNNYKKILSHLRLNDANTEVINIFEWIYGIYQREVIHK